jgi:dipeptidyl aminopeptidase/acylaminoacyl peptidase
VAATGGEPVGITKPETGDHRFPSFLPGGRHVLFYWQAPGELSRAGLYVASLDSGEATLLAAAETSGVYAAPGLLLFGRQEVLLAQPFDTATRRLTGEPVPVAENLESGVFGGVVSFSVSDTGTLAYGIGTGREVLDQLTWFDRQGKPIGTVDQPGDYIGIDLSPDDKLLAVHRHEQGIGGDLWLVDLVRGTNSRFTFEPSQDNAGPVFSPDGRRIAFSSLRNTSFDTYVKPTNGTAAEKQVVVPDRPSGPGSWSADGKHLLYVTSPSNFSRGLDVGMVPLDGGKPVPLLRSAFAELYPSVSPNGKWIAYTSDETGREEVYVRPFPSGDGKWQVSTAGGSEHRWRGDSKELFFLDRPQLGTMMAVEINGTGSAVVVGTPRRLFTTALLTSNHPGLPIERQYAVSRDGQRFVMPVNPRSSTFTASESAPMAVVLNWTARLKK